MINKSPSPMMLRSSKTQIINKFISIPKEKEKYEPDADTVKFFSDKWNINILPNIGYGGFSMVKLVQSKITNDYYACKVVIIFYK